ncbi:MAG TPA: hypothetical protein VGD27_14115 [Longimicrobiales bacterium]
MKTSRTALAGVAIAAFFASSFNSEEHKLIADRGVAAVIIPASVKLPSGVVFAPVEGETYLSSIKLAKLLAVGFDTNDERDFSRSTRAVQDNCYYTKPVNIYKQADYNRKLWIPPLSEVPARVLWVPGYANRDSAHAFSFGELVGFYGDYRQIPYCEGGICYMTSDDIGEVKFLHAPLISSKYCPATMSAETFIAHVGSGLVPPFGALGNAVFNTADDITDYWDAGWWGDEMLRIAKVNDWHFSRVAVAWYVGMHRLALLYADSARMNPDYWVKALHYEANALHSLTDLFAFGHVVTNSDETSHEIIDDSRLADKAAYQWMENVIAMGGGLRAENGRVQTGAALPAVADRPAPRNAVQELKPDVDVGLRKVAEMLYHDTFNKSGAVVRNLRGDEFEIYGDGDLHKLIGIDPVAVDAVTGAVTASVQALFNAYDAAARGSATLSQLSADTAFFAALRYVPVYVVRDPEKYFTGRWTIYAKAINELSGANRLLQGWPQCQVAFITGGGLASTVPEIANIPVTGEMLEWPKVQEKACADF